MIEGQLIEVLCIWKIMSMDRLKYAYHRCHNCQIALKMKY